MLFLSKLAEIKEKEQYNEKVFAALTIHVAWGKSQFKLPRSMGRIKERQNGKWDGEVPPEAVLRVWLVTARIYFNRFPLFI